MVVSFEPRLCLDFSGVLFHLNPFLCFETHCQMQALWRRYPYFLCITVLQCALGDPVAAEESFMQHLQYVFQIRNTVVHEKTR